MGAYEKMTAIADKIRGLLGISEKMGLDAMATNLGTEQTNVTNAFTAIGNKGGTVPSSKVSGNLASAINSIPTGVTVQTKTGSLRTNSSGVATVNCGFKPDIVYIYTGTMTDGTNSAESGLCACFSLRNTNNAVFTAAFTAAAASTFYEAGLEQTNNGFEITLISVSVDWSQSLATYKTLNYKAVKYTE